MSSYRKGARAKCEACGDVLHEDATFDEAGQRVCTSCRDAGVIAKAASTTSGALVPARVSLELSVAAGALAAVGVATTYFIAGGTAAFLMFVLLSGVFVAVTAWATRRGG